MEGRTTTVVRITRLIKQKNFRYGSLKVWAGVDSNHRSLATADLQSAPFSLSGTYPYLVFKKLPLTGFEPVASPLPRECATPAPQRLTATRAFCRKISDKIAGNRNRTYNLRFTKPLLYR